MSRKLAALSGCLIAMAVAGCSSWLPRSGPSADSVVAQAKPADKVLFDVVKVDSRVLATVLDQPRQEFRGRFPQSAKPPPLKIAVGDTIAVTIWEAGGNGGLFGTRPPSASGVPKGLTAPPNPAPRFGRPPASGARPGAKPDATLKINLDADPRAVRKELITAQQYGAPKQGFAPPGNGPADQHAPANTEMPADGRTAEATQAEARTGGITIEDQLVNPAGTISIPFAGRIKAAGRTPGEVARTIERRLAGKAVSPQVVVADKQSAANSVAVNGDVVHGARIPLSSGARLLQVIAEAGGARAPIRDTLVHLSRGGTTATIPLATLIRDPAENIYAEPGDVLTLTLARKTFSVFGATGANAAITLDADTVNLAQALGKAHGLRDDLANATGVFLFRYEPDRLVRALGQPLATRAADGVSPVVYRFDLADAKSYFFARRFPVRNHDIIFVADADLIPLYKWFGLLSQVIGPIGRAALVCRQSNC